MFLIVLVMSLAFNGWAISPAQDGKVRNSTERVGKSVVATVSSSAQAVALRQRHLHSLLSVQEQRGTVLELAVQILQCRSYSADLTALLPASPPARCPCLLGAVWGPWPPVGAL